MITTEQFYEIADKAKRYDDLLKFSGKNPELCCSFCGKAQSEVAGIVAGPNVYICDECVDLCNEILGEGEEDGTTETTDGNESRRSAGASK
ncbi:hypothetical protein IFU39_16630 [Paenibacillus sp. CFBP 13594]|uniref:ClpX C4-type zinc finger protein n=1 Tax=Paenibacillus sp. CFBP 13594 TaxID=2774037 RepID=UPI001780E2C0|nr:ClpX C4-type zinc finger protein [Paenibacillus sp. CFBP 13594]MBD8839440.1 hypothetical protein [Paenibacillus sp. CFBP 13594]